MLSFILVDKCCDVIDILPANVMKWVNINAGAGNSDMEQHIMGGVKAGQADARQAMMGGGKEKGPGGPKSGGGDKVDPSNNQTKGHHEQRE